MSKGSSALKSKGQILPNSGNSNDFQHNVNVFQRPVNWTDFLKVSDSTPCGVQQRKKSHLQSLKISTLAAGAMK